MVKIIFLQWGVMAVLALTQGGAERLQFLALTGPLFILAAPSPPFPSISRSTKCKFPPSCCPKKDASAVQWTNQGAICANLAATAPKLQQLLQVSREAAGRRRFAPNLQTRPWLQVSREARCGHSFTLVGKF
jgi:hypothetical protein